jgi:hypothetical protein
MIWWWWWYTTTTSCVVEDAPGDAFVLGVSYVVRAEEHGRLDLAVTMVMFIDQRKRLHNNLRIWFVIAVDCTATVTIFVRIGHFCYLCTRIRETWADTMIKFPQNIKLRENGEPWLLRVGRLFWGYVPSHLGLLFSPRCLTLVLV